MFNINIHNAPSNIFRKLVLSDASKPENNKDTDIRNYAKYVLQSGRINDKRELLVNIRSKILYKDKSLDIK